MCTCVGGGVAVAVRYLMSTDASWHNAALSRYRMTRVEADTGEEDQGAGGEEDDDAVARGRMIPCWLAVTSSIIS